MESLFDHPLVTERYFFPRREPPRGRVDVEVHGATLACAAHRVHGPSAPLLVHFHGNGEVVADYVRAGAPSEVDLANVRRAVVRPERVRQGHRAKAPARRSNTPEVAQMLAAAGLDTFFVEYRGYGGSTGEPALVGMLRDVEVVLASLDRPLDRVFVYGRSIGSIYAIEAARRRPAIGGLILESGIASPLERVLLRVRPEELGASLEELERDAHLHLDHEQKLGAYPGRTLVLHARGDDLVDLSHAKRNASWARRSELVLFERGDHNTILAYNLPAIVEAVSRFASREAQR